MYIVQSVLLTTVTLKFKNFLYKYVTYNIYTYFCIFILKVSRIYIFRQNVAHETTKRKLPAITLRNVFPIQARRVTVIGQLDLKISLMST